MTLSAAEEDALRSLLGRIKTDKFSGTPLRGGLPQMVQRTALPTAAKELAGQIIWIPGVSGVADHAWICLKDAADAYSWVPLDTAAGAGLGAVDFLTGTVTGLLSAEIVVGTTPGGELGNTWANPTVDTTHSGSAHIVLPAGELTGSNATPTVAATHSGSAHSQILRYSNTAEQTTTSTSAVDLLTSSAISIPVTSGIIIEGVARKTAGAAVAATLGLKLNATVVVEAALSTYQIWVASATDRAESGAFRVEIMPRSANYLNAGIGTYSITGSGTVGTGPIIAGTANFPNAAITAIALRAISGSASVTVAVKEVAVYEVLYS